MSDVTRAEFNGLGERVTTLDKEHAVTRNMTDNQEKMIDAAFGSIKQLGHTSEKHVETMQKANTALLVKIVFIVGSAALASILTNVFAK